MEGFCRGCLIKYDEPSELLLYTEKNRRLFIYCTGIQVKRNDTLGFQLCQDCYLNMKLACKFKKTCRTSDKKVKNYIKHKEENTNVDFCTFLKKHDDSLAVRFPFMSSTPANQAIRDGDNESTCTSFKNFMTDILQGEEMPATEAQIIHEVIAEEADVMDDSLDSYWLQDDLSIDTDFRLDFSFSPFSTPRSIQNDHCYTPMKLSDLKQELSRENYSYTPKNEVKKGVVSSLTNTDLNFAKYNGYHNDLDHISNILEIDKLWHNNPNTVQETHPQELHVSNNTFDEPVQIEVDYGKVEPETLGVKCTIDINLEEALKNESNQEFCLDDLLVSPQVFPKDTPSPSPSLTNILFGNELEGNDLNKNEVGQLIEKFADVDGDIEVFQEFFNKNNSDLEKYDNGIQSEGTVNVDESDIFSTENKFDIDNSFCIICDKKFINSKALRIHAVKTHKLKINNPHKKDYKYKLRVCDVCGKGFRDAPTFYRHKNRHKEENTVFKCELCGIILSSESKLKMHMMTHGRSLLKDTGKKYVCNICGAISRHYANFRLHQMRHSKAYTKNCDECGKGFFRSTDLITHMRSHTGERPFNCELCPRSFSRRDGLIRHIKAHTDERRFHCDHCKNRFITKMSLQHHIKNSKACIKLRDSLQPETNTEDLEVIDVVYVVGSQDKINNKSLIFV